MPWKLWMLDLAREQSPTLDHLYQYAMVAQDAGYDALGLYLEHRFAFECTPWSHGQGCVTPAMIQNLQSEFPSLQIVPFINLLGHFEGFLYTEEGRPYREELFTGLQACPSNPDFIKLCQQIIDETVRVFKSDLIHIGGDETYQLGRCDKCQSRMEGQSDDPKAWLYGEHFAPLAQRVVEHGRRPGVWGDMFLEHPGALQSMPENTLIFDWQYQGGVAETSNKFPGFEVVACPALHVYNAIWMHTGLTEENVRAVARDTHDMGLYGAALTTWEAGLFGAFDTQFPAIKWAAEVFDNPSNEPSLIEAYGESSEWARLMGVELEKLGGVFKGTKLRNQLKVRLLLYGNPFLAWMHHGTELGGDTGMDALAIIEKAIKVAPDEATKNASFFARSAVEAVRIMNEAHKHYARREADAAISKLTPLRHLFDTLEKLAKQNVERIGSSRADIERCRAAKRHVEIVMQRIRDYGRGELGYLPAFEVLANHRFMPHDQGCWWIVNKWANE